MSMKDGDIVTFSAELQAQGLPARAVIRGPVEGDNCKAWSLQEIPNMVPALKLGRRPSKPAGAEE